MALRRITARKFTWNFSDVGSQYWLSGSPVLTNLLDVYTMLVPDNEKYYIRSLEPCLALLPEEGQKAELREFFRQESLHGIAHKKYWDVLSANGFEVGRFIAVVNTILYRILEPLQPTWLRLSVVAAIEHINASLGNVYLGKKLLRGAAPELKQLFEWHFAEEIEHKAVAHRTLQALFPGYFTRIVGAALVFPVFFGILLSGTLLMLFGQRELTNWATWKDLRAYLIDEGVLSGLAAHVGRYFIPGFEPWDLDDYALADEILNTSKGIEADYYGAPTRSAAAEAG